MEIKGIGILGIFLVATFFSCGCIDTPMSIPIPTPISTPISTPTPTPTPTPQTKIVEIVKIIIVEVEKLPEVNETAQPIIEDAWKVLYEYNNGTKGMLIFEDRLEAEVAIKQMEKNVKEGGNWILLHSGCLVISGDWKGDEFWKYVRQENRTDIEREDYD